WLQLTATQQHFFTAFAPFHGRTFTSNAIAHITKSTLQATEDTLHALLNLSLLSPVDTHHYRQHALLADFSHEKARDYANDWLPTTQTRMVTYYTQFAHDHQTNYDGLRPEWVNLHAAIDFAHSLQQWQAVLDLTQTLTPAWFTRARYNDVRKIYPLATEAAQQVADHTAHAQILVKWGTACIEQDDLDQAATLLQKAVTLCLDTDDQPHLSDAYLQLSRISLERGQYEEAHQYTIDGQQIKHKLGDKEGEAFALFRLARLYRNTGQLDAAESFCNKAISYLQKNDPIEIRCLRLIAQTYLDRKQFDIAESYCIKAIKICRHINNKDELASSIYQALVACVRLKKEVYIYQHAQECLPLFEQLGSRKMQGLALYELSQADAFLDPNYSKALEKGYQSLEILNKINSIFNIILVQDHIGKILLKDGQRKAACDIWKIALAAAKKTKHF
ncbi:MAG: tetratricopeptide repeat protein, partial [Methylococcales bacterium]|nr:tetratricopeptide repeat protein [Methylococcales bacterium]